MELLKLTQGEFALIDDEDFERLNQHKWTLMKSHHHWRGAGRWITKNKKEICMLMHHEIIGKPPRGLMVDHRDGDGLNNQRDNLRFVTMRQNQQNRHRPKVSRYPGVCWLKNNKKWQAAIKIQGKSKYLGSFSNEREAFLVYQKAVEGLGEVVLGVEGRV